MNSPSLDAIDQFTVDTNGFKAEFGRAGGGMISFVSKSGTDQYHGAAFEFVRNNYFDARGFFAKSVAIYRQHDFGASVGGPVRLPKLYNGTGKSFFFFSYEGFRNRVGASPTPIAVPPPEFYSGDFSHLVANAKDANGNYIPITLYDPATTTFNTSTNQYVRSPFPNNQIPQSRIDPSAAQSTPSPNRPCRRPTFARMSLPEPGNTGNKTSTNRAAPSTPTTRLASAGPRPDSKASLSFYFGYNKKTAFPVPTGPLAFPAS